MFVINLTGSIYSFVGPAVTRAFIFLFLVLFIKKLYILLVYPNFMNVTNTSLNTTIENEYGAKVSTIEHLMGALFCLGIDNALIEIDNEEVPILDGYAKVFIDKIISAGRDVSEFPIKVI